MASKSNEIIKPATGLTQIEEVPEFLRSQLGHSEGMENVDQEDILIPRLGLCQALSPQKRKTHALYIPNLQEGQLFNTVTQEIYGDELDIVLLFFFKNRIKFFGIDEGGGIDCNSPNAIDMGRLSPDGCSVCRFSKFGNGSKEGDAVNDKPECTLYHNLMSFIPQQIAPIAISFKSTGLKVTKQLLANIRLSRLPMYAKKYKVTVVTSRSGENEWFEKKITPLGFVDPDMFKEMERNFHMLRQANVKVDTTGESEEFDTDDMDTAAERAY